MADTGKDTHMKINQPQDDILTSMLERGKVTSQDWVCSPGSPGSAMSARRMRHGKTTYDDLTLFNIEQDSPLALFSRHPAAVSVSPNAVTYRGLPFTIARPSKWQRSVGSSDEINGGRQRGEKRAERSMVHRQEKRVFTTHNSSFVPHAIS